MCSSLARVYSVSLVVADGLGDQVENNVNIFDVGKKTGGRISRMTKTVDKVFLKAIDLDSDIYHLHDPELIPIGLKLKKIGKIVIFDSHEDVAKQMLTKPYLIAPLRRLIAIVFSIYERYSCKKFDAIITATPSIKDKFININSNTININNFPLVNELNNYSPWENKKNEVAYIGGITKIRGIEQILEALDLTTGIKLNLGGEFGNQQLESDVKALKGWRNVKHLGFLSRNEVFNILERSRAGLVTFLPAPNHIDAQPNKMFEYMSAGIPVIASNFPLWREIIEGNDCGLCVEPLNPGAISKAIQYLNDFPEESKRMGENGKKAVLERYNWNIEERLLFDLYKRLA